jgi:YesN/AraC family two-component response regulator
MEKKTILLVEDDDVVRDMIRGALQRGYRVLEASKCSEAAKKLPNRFDLALIDYDLPDGDGFEVLERIREMQPAMPVIMMTGFSRKDLVIRALRAGVTDYIEKPICFKYLLSKIARVLGGPGVVEVNEPDTNRGAAENRDEFVVDGIAMHIREYYMRDLPLNAVSKMANMNRSKFCAIFKKRFGQTFTAYLKNVRVRNASELLRNSSLSVTEISHAVGYGSVVHFDRVFRDVHGLSPKEYRRRNAKSSTQ